MLTYTDLTKGFEFGPWTVLPERDLIRDGEQERHIEPIVMNVFVVLASHGGGVVTRNQLIDAVWNGRPQSDEVITRCISSLRRSLGDDAKTPKYIETLQKRGYRVMQRVRLPDATEPERGTSFSLRPMQLLLLTAGLVAVITFGALFIDGRTTTPPDPTISSVAVYPFDCKLAASNPSAHLCHGFAEEAISTLQKIRDLRVIRMRVPYSGTPPDNVQGIVTGSVQIIGDQVKIAALLENTRSGSAICCDTFDATQRSIFATQKQVARALVEAIVGRNLATATSSPASFDSEMAYSAGRYLFEKRDHDSIVDAVEQFKKAIDIDPDYGAAWLYLAYTYVNWPDYDFVSVDREAMYDEAIEAIEHGIGADPGITEAAGTVYGFVYHKRKQWQAAEEAFETAIGAETGQPIAYHWYSYFMASVGRLDAALDQALHALQLDPNKLSTISRVAILALYNNDYDTASRYFEMADLMGLENYAHSFMYSLLLYRQGRFDEAKASGKRGLELSGASDTRWFDLIVDGSRVPELRLQAAQTLDQISAMNVLPANVEMFFWLLLDDVDRALSIARRLEQEDGLYETELLFTDEARAMRQHPEFAEFIEAIGLTEYWASAGCSWSDDKVRCQ